MTAGQVKRWGRKQPILSNWDEVKYSYMRSFVHEKFFWNTELRELLLATNDALLIEGNTWGDTYWGVCNGKGENNLGKILMKVREEIRSDYK